MLPDVQSGSNFDVTSSSLFFVFPLAVCVVQFYSADLSREAAESCAAKNAQTSH